PDAVSAALVPRADRVAGLAQPCTRTRTRHDRRLPAVASRSCAARHLVRAAARDVQRARAALEKDQRRPACTACIAANDVSRLLPRKPRALRSGEGLAARV